MNTTLDNFIDFCAPFLKFVQKWKDKVSAVFVILFLLIVSINGYVLVSHYPWILYALDAVFLYLFMRFAYINAYGDTVVSTRRFMVLFLLAIVIFLLTLKILWNFVFIGFVIGLGALLSYLIKKY